MCSLRVSKLCVVVMTVLLFTGCSGGAPSQNAALKTADSQSIQLALYPWVPRFDQFKTAIESRWSSAHPDIALQILPKEEWDGGYKDEPSPNMDVFVFDALFLNYFIEKNILEPVEAGQIAEMDDFLKYAIDGVKINDSYYGIPLLGCSNILFYREGDSELENAQTLSEVNVALGQCKYTSEIPPNPEGLMVDMSGGTTNAGNYVNAEHWITQLFPVNLPWSEDEIDTEAIRSLQKIMAMASYYNSTSENPNPYARGSWFGENHGRAYIGFTESLSSMSSESRSKTKFKIMPFSDTSTNPLFYSDVIGINTATQTRGTKELAIELANILASADNMVASFEADSSGAPQYLIPTRNSAFERLSQSDPVYQNIYTMVQSADPILFTLNGKSRDWIEQMKSTITNVIQDDYPCGCDYEAGPIMSQGDADAKCPDTCTPYGGWNGQWTTTIPGTMSVCGCNTCPIPQG